MTSYEKKHKELELLREREKIRASKEMARFIKYTNKKYVFKPFHKAICGLLDRFEKGEIKKLAIFVPPQHGKSEMSSRAFPSYALGRNPDRKIALCSYGADHAQAFNRDVQRIIDSSEYQSVFPDTLLNSKNVSTDAKGSYKRTANIFETVGRTGFMKTVGVGGALTGTTVDIGIIDDPFKDREEANSATIRNRVWNWYTDVFESRLHNKSQQLLLFTRWHQDDLGGRVLQRDGEYSKKNPNGWVVVILRAIKEEGDDGLNSEWIKDERRVGEALWEDRHSRERLNNIAKNSPRTFASLYQQRPAPRDGGIIKKDWFGTYPKWEVEALIERGLVTPHCYIDTALSEKEQKNNDPTGMLFFVFHKNVLYLLNYYEGRWGFPELIKKIKEKTSYHKFSSQSKVVIENKANGKSVKQQLTGETRLNIILDNIKGDKIARAEDVSPFIEGGRVKLPEGDGWVSSFIDSIAVFPNGKHDEPLDTLTGSIRITRTKKKQQIKYY